MPGKGGGGITNPLLDPRTDGHGESGGGIVEEEGGEVGDVGGRSVEIRQLSELSSSQREEGAIKGNLSCADQNLSSSCSSLCCLVSLDDAKIRAMTECFCHLQTIETCNCSSRRCLTQPYHFSGNFVLFCA